MRQAERLAETEEELRRAQEELERRVEQRTAELAEANRRLRIEIDERKRAEDRAQQHLAELAHVARLSTVGEMMAELAHELNQPLSAICSHAQACTRLLASGDRDYAEDLSASLNQVNEQGTRAAEIIRHVRRFVVKAKPSEAVVDVNAMIRDVAELMSIDARLAGAETVLELAEPLPTVVGDRIQLEQVLVNLMRNGFEALRESDREPRRLIVRTALDGASTIVVGVRDNGLGIASDVFDRIFERFFTTKAGGMGMGLSVSQSIIKSHGGTLWAAPVPDGGAVVPFHLADPTRESTTVETDPTVFIVDDDPAVRQALMALVRSMRLRAETYESAQQFLDAFDAGRPGCMLLDVRMPGISGLGLLEQFNREEIPLPTIVMSAYGDVPMVVRAMKAGALNFLEKPCRDQQLWEAIQEAIKWDADHRERMALRAEVRHRLQRLTRGEHDVLALLIDGKPNRTIAAELNLSVRTIEVRRAKIMDKMKADSLAELIRLTLSADPHYGKRPAQATSL